VVVKKKRTESTRPICLAEFEKPFYVLNF